MGEMGRTPAGQRQGRPRPLAAVRLQPAGRRRRHEQGTSTAPPTSIAAYPASDPVSPGDLVATIYHLLGIDPHMMVPDRTGRPMPIAHGGEPIRGVIL